MSAHLKSITWARARRGFRFHLVRSVTRQTWGESVEYRCGNTGHWHDPEVPAPWRARHSGVEHIPEALVRADPDAICPRCVDPDLAAEFLSRPTS